MCTKRYGKLGLKMTLNQLVGMNWPSAVIV